jgi:diguanylate cyclase
MISIADKFNLELIAEGVETKEQFEKLKSMGCKYFQGYLFAKPVPLLELCKDNT